MRTTEGWMITKNGGKLLIDISLKGWGAKSEMKYIQRETVCYDDTATIISRGYRQCLGLKNQLAYYNMPIFVQFHNFRKCDYRNGYTDDMGNVVQSGELGAYP